LPCNPIPNANGDIAICIILLLSHSAAHHGSELRE
jgi:hypothetical protein